jgi:hypothetical protein
MMKYQSYAVTAKRIEPKDGPDDFPTPPWATRALVEHVIGDKPALASMSCLEPACGAGHLAKVLKEYFGEVRCADAFHYGYGPVRDFLTYPYEANSSRARAWPSWRERCSSKPSAGTRRSTATHRRANSRSSSSAFPQPACGPILASLIRIPITAAAARRYPATLPLGSVGSSPSLTPMASADNVVD